MLNRRYDPSGCVGSHTAVAGAVYDVIISTAGYYMITVDWGYQSYADKSYVQWNSIGTRLSHIIVATDDNENQQQSSSPIYLSAGSHSLHIGTVIEDAYFTVPWCNIAIDPTTGIVTFNYKKCSK